MVAFRMRSSGPEKITPLLKQPKSSNQNHVIEVLIIVAFNFLRQVMSRSAIRVHDVWRNQTIETLWHGCLGCVMSCVIKKDFERCFNDHILLCLFCVGGGVFSPQIRLTYSVNGTKKIPEISWGSQHVGFQTSLGMWIEGRELLEL